MAKQFFATTLVPWLVAGGLVLGSLGLAQFDPAKQWFVLRSEHFDVIYHSGLEGVAPEAAQFAEQAYTTLKAEFEEPPGRLRLVLSDLGEVMNGFANPTNNVVGIFSAQFRSSEIFNPRLSSWWETVIFHEVVHMFDLSQARGPLKDRSKLFGQLPSQNAIKPVPLLEGTAVYMKQKYLGESRLNDALTRMVIRQMVVEGQYPTLDEVRQYYSKSTWPTVGFLAYNYGSWLVRYLETRFGSDAYKRFTKANAALLATKDFNQPFQQAFGLSLDQLYQDFVRWLPSQFADEITGIRLEAQTPIAPLTRLGFYSESPTDSKNGLVYAHASTLRSGLRLLKDGQEHELLNGPATYPQWSPDGGKLLFTGLSSTGPYSLNSNLYLYDHATGQTQALIKDQRVYYARFAADGQSIFVAQNTPDGSTHLGRYSLKDKALTSLRSFPHQDGVIHSFAASPDGSFLVLALLRRGGFQDLYRYTLGSGELEALTQDPNVDSDPVFSPDGQYVVYSSDPGRVYNLYARRLSDGTTFKLTNLMGGAFSPTFSTDGKNLIFSGYDSSGYNLYSLPYQPQSFKPFALKNQPLPEYKPTTLSKAVPYNPFDYLRPLYWLPSGGLYLDDLGFGGYLGVSFSASDPVGQHAYSVGAGFDSSLRGLNYDVGYTYAGWGLPLSLRLLGSGRENIQAFGTRFWSPGGGLGLQYVRSDVLEPLLSTQANTLTHSFSANLSGSNLSGEDLFRVRAALSAGATAFNRNQGPDWHYSIRGALGLQFRLPLEASHLLTLRIGGAYTTSSAVIDRFDLGLGTVGVVYGNLSALSVRGYAPGQLVGSSAVVGSLEYRLPPLQIERGLGNWPLFFDDLSLSVFADAGTAGSSVDFNQLRFGLGAEVRLSLSLMYLATGSSIAIGGAYGLGEPGPRFYLNLNVPFPLASSHDQLPVLPQEPLP